MHAPKLKVTGIIGAELRIIAKPIVANVNATRIRIAGVRRTIEAVITFDHCPRDTLTQRTDITVGASITIIARGDIHYVQTTNTSIAGVIGAGAAIITIERLSRGTDTTVADVSYGANIVI